MSEVTEQEVTQYDRQIRLWGLEAQQRLRNAKVALFGLGALGGEIAKNLVLAGIGEINVCDNRPVTEKTLLMTNGTDFKTVAEASSARIQELNPRVTFKVLDGTIKDQSAETLSSYTVVIMTDLYDKEELCRVSAICRDKNVKLIIGAQFGMFGVGFNDFQQHEYVYDTTEGKQEKETINFTPFVESVDAQEPKISKRLAKKRFYLPLHAFKSILESSIEVNDLKVNEKYNLDEEVLTNCRIQVPPVGAIVGGVLGQEAIKAIGLKEAPIENWFLFNGEQMAGNTIKI